ncbi:TetR/AcrR family transcriptional regulator [Microbacterium sp. 179-B 1A2 NHS]|uniref:TetR/AcrR family transcriptional regulator n=1 Tax=Microbacterium sp. 179-B 1A2 NHS TaxID=3142383 RepID=UPI0039A0027D
MEPQPHPVIGRRGSQPKGVARRQEILDRAIDVFRERGADGTSLRRIAEAIGVSHAALLHYFDSREQLLVAVYAHAEARNAAQGERVPGIETMVHAAIRNVEIPGLVKLYSTLVAASLESASEVGHAFFSARFERLRSTLTASLQRQQDAGEVRADVPADHLAALIIAASDGLQIQWLLEPSVELEATLRTLGDLLQPPR